jgi:hypothetical protein
MPGKVAVDVSATIKQHDQQSGHNQGHLYPSLLDRFKLSKYAPYVKELYSVLQAEACFVVAFNKFLKFSKIICNFIVLHVVFVCI